MSILLRCFLGAGVIIASLSGAFTQDFWFGDLAELAARSWTRADAIGDAQRIIFVNDTITRGRHEGTLGEKVIDPNIGTHMQISRTNMQIPQ